MLICLYCDNEIEDPDNAITTLDYRGRDIFFCNWDCYDDNYAGPAWDDEEEDDEE